MPRAPIAIHPSLTPVPDFACTIPDFACVPFQNIFCPIFLRNTVHAQIDAVSAAFLCKLTSLCSALRPEWLAGCWLARSSGGGGVRISEQNFPYPTVGFTVAACRSILKHKAKTDSAPPMIQPVAGVVQNHHAASPSRESFKPTPNAL